MADVDAVKPFRFDKLDFTKLYREAVKKKRFYECPMCEFGGDESPKYLCWCGVCFKYHHGEYFHEDAVEDYPGELLPGGEFVK